MSRRKRNSYRCPWYPKIYCWIRKSKFKKLKCPIENKELCRTLDWLCEESCAAGINLDPGRATKMDYDKVLADKSTLFQCFTAPDMILSFWASRDDQDRFNMKLSGNTWKSICKDLIKSWRVYNAIQNGFIRKKEEERFEKEFGG